MIKLFIHCCKKTAFTLAETLIVMGIIGVVAALTIPNLTQSTGEKEKVAKLQKIYSNLNDAFGRATAIYGPIEEWSVNDRGDDVASSKRFVNRISDFMKIINNCGVATNGTCYTNNVKLKDINGNSGTYVDIGNSAAYVKFILADGASIGMYFGAPSCSSDSSDGSYDSPLKNLCGSLYVDIDGPNKGPFTWGKDIFIFHLTKTGIYPAGARNSQHGKDNDALKTNCLITGAYCAGWVIETGNMDYLKATNGTCPNGTVLNWTNTSCK